MPETLDTLPTELIENILIYVIYTSPRTSRSLYLTNKRLLEVVKIVRSRRRTVRFDKDRQTYEPAQFNAAFFEHTHHLTIEASDPSNPHLYNQGFIVQLLGTIENLKSLNWNVGPISIEVLSALNRLHPRCALRVFQWWRLDGDLNQLDEAEIALAKFENLTHFRYVTVSDPSAAATLTETYSWEPFQEIVARSRRLELASFLSNSIYRDADAPEWVGEAASNIRANKKAKRDTLRSLTIDCPNLTLSSSTLQEINKFVDLSALEYLKFSRGRAQDYFQVAGTLLPNLKHISLNFNNSTDELLLKAAGEYLRTCSPVQTLSLWGWTSVVSIPDLVARHGSSLQVLQLHEKDVLYTGSRSTPALSDVKILMESCPNLNDLTIDLSIGNTKYEVRPDEPIVEILKVIADRKLQKVQIYLSADALRVMLFMHATKDIDASDGNQVTTYSVDHPYHQQARKGKTAMIAYRSQLILPVVEPCVTAIWNLLYGQCTSGERLLDVKFGDWETRTPIADPGLEPRTFCQVRPHERDDRAGQCVVRTRHWSRYFSNGIAL